MMRSLRTLTGWSQTELGNRAGGLGQVKISLIERGKSPTPDEARQIAAAFGVPVGWVFPEHAALEKVPAPPDEPLGEQAKVSDAVGMLMENVEKLIQKTTQALKAMDSFVQLLAKAGTGRG